MKYCNLNGLLVVRKNNNRNHIELFCCIFNKTINLGIETCFSGRDSKPDNIGPKHERLRHMKALYQVSLQVVKFLTFCIQSVNELGFALIHHVRKRSKFDKMRIYHCLW